jgi:hypothetical protein
MPENFQVIRYGDNIFVEFDVRIRVTDASLNDYWRIMRDIQGVEGIVSTYVEDVPPALVERFTRGDEDVL